MKKPHHSLYARHRFPAEVISLAVWLYYRFPLSLPMVEEILAARGIEVSHEMVRRWAEKFGREYANRIRRRAPRPGDRWHLDEVAITIAGNGTGCGEPLIRTASRWMSWSKAAGIAKLPSACCAS
jgi:putative transposase